MCVPGRPINHRELSSSRSLNDALDSRNKKGTMFLICSHIGVGFMLRLFVEEAAALASISLFIGMIAVWAQVIPQL